MSWGRFEKKMIASAKLSALEKYGFTYNEDITLIEECMSPDIRIEFLDNEGHIKVVCRNGRDFEAYVRNFIPKRQPMCQAAAVDGARGTAVVNAYGAPGDDERKSRYVSVWDVKSH